MATKNRKVETRLDDDTYRLLEQIAEDSETSIYELIQRFIEWGVELSLIHISEPTRRS